MAGTLIFAFGVIALLAALWRALDRRVDAVRAQARASVRRWPLDDEPDTDLAPLLHAALPDAVGCASSAPLRVGASAEQLRALVGHLQALLGPGTGTASLRWVALPDGSEAVLHVLDTAAADGHSRLAELFDRRRGATPASGAATPASGGPRSGAEVPSSGEMQAHVAQCERIVHRHKGRIDAEPSPLGLPGLAVRLPRRG